MRSAIFHYLTLWPPVGYLFIFVGLAVEGEATLFAVAFLTKLGYFSLTWALAATLSGVFIGDFLWYVLGRYLEAAPVLIRQWVARVAAPFDGHIARRPLRTIFITKFAYGIHHAVLVRAGSLNLPLDRLMRCDVAASVVWILVVGSLGYFSGASLALGERYLRSAEVTLLVGLALFVAVQRAWTKFSRSTYEH